MIKLLSEGDYLLGETKNGTKIVKLDSKGNFAWLHSPKIGDILMKSKNTKTEKTLAQGYFRFYEVENEPRLTDLIHLEVCIGKGSWQGYLLPTGLPKTKDKNRIISTKELISKSCNC